MSHFASESTIYGKNTQKKNKSQQNIHLKDMINNDNTQQIHEQIHEQNSVIKHNTTPEPPPYTNMKHSTKPTYREWKYKILVKS